MRRCQHGRTRPVRWRRYVLWRTHIIVLEHAGFMAELWCPEVIASLQVSENNKQKRNKYSSERSPVWQLSFIPATPNQPYSPHTPFKGVHQPRSSQLPKVRHPNRSSPKQTKRKRGVACLLQKSRRRKMCRNSWNSCTLRVFLMEKIVFRRTDKCSSVMDSN